MTTLTTSNIANYIKAHLHQLGNTRHIIIPATNITITRADFERVADGITLGDILSCEADIDWVAHRLSIIVQLRQADNDTDQTIVFARLVKDRAIVVFATDNGYDVCDCLVIGGFMDAILIKWVQTRATRADARLLANQWVTDYTL